LQRENALNRGKFNWRAKLIAEDESTTAAGGRCGNAHERSGGKQKKRAGLSHWETTKKRNGGVGGGETVRGGDSLSLRNQKRGNADQTLGWNLESNSSKKSIQGPYRQDGGKERLRGGYSGKSPSHKNHAANEVPHPLQFDQWKRPG